MGYGGCFVGRCRFGIVRPMSETHFQCRGRHLLAVALYHETASTIRPLSTLKIESLKQGVTFLHDPLKKLAVFVDMDSDTSADNPLDSAGADTIISLNRRHNNFSLEKFEAHAKDPHAVLLSYYEHGNCAWFPQGQGGAGMDCPFDSVRLAGLWLPGPDVADQAAAIQDSAERRAWLRQQAAACCEMYSAWCNGEVYRWELSVFPALYDGNGEPYDRPADYRRTVALYLAEDSGIYLLREDDRASALNDINRELAAAVESVE